MTLHLLDSRTERKVPFEPLADTSVGLYVCGVTPYDTGHLGHAFTYVSFDVLHRYLEYLGYHVILALDSKPGVERKFEDIREVVKDVYADRMREAIVARMRQSARIEVAPAPK